MSRPTTEPTIANPFLASWAAADPDITNSGADSPILIPTGILNDVDFLYIQTAGSDNANAPVWHLILTDLRRGSAAAIKATISSGVLAALTPDRRQAEANDAGHFLHTPVRFDLRGMITLGDARTIWHLALTTLGGAGDTVRLLHWYSLKHRPS